MFLFSFDKSGFTLLGLDIRWYGVMIALGALMAVLLAARREKKLSLPKDTALDVALWCIPIAIVCARLYYVAFSWDYYAADPAKIFSIHEGGLAIYGGIIGGLLTGWLYARAKKLSFLRLADLAAPSVALGQAIGRWGNFFNQEAFGLEVTNPSLQFFPIAVFIESENAWHCATFFYESLWCLLIVAVLLIMERKNFFRRTGDVFFWYALLYAAERTVVEGLRTDSLFWGPVRVSQALSLIALIAVCLLFVLRARGLRPFFRTAAIIYPIAVAFLLFAGILVVNTLNCTCICTSVVILSCAVYLKNTPDKSTT